ncbi:pentapeptide repeat-containing protein [Paenibacillus tarimensis]
MRIEKEMKAVTIVESNVSGTSFTNTMAEDMKFECCNVSRASFNNVNMTGTKISDANMSEFDVDGAQWGGAHFRYIGYDNASDPASRPHPIPVQFTSCNISNGVMADCNLSNVQLKNCDISGLTIDGIRIDELLEKHRAEVK